MRWYPRAAPPRALGRRRRRFAGSAGSADTTHQHRRGERAAASLGDAPDPESRAATPARRLPFTRDVSKTAPAIPGPYLACAAIAPRLVTNGSSPGIAVEKSDPQENLTEFRSKISWHRVCLLYSPGGFGGPVSDRTVPDRTRANHPKGWDAKLLA